MAHEWLLNVVDVDLQKAMQAMKLGGKFTPDDVRKAYQRRVMETRCHPDQGGDEGLFKRLTAARDLLLKSFEVRQAMNYGAKHKQGPMGQRKDMKLIDRVLHVLRSVNTLDEAIEEVEKMR